MIANKYRTTLRCFRKYLPERGEPSEKITMFDFSTLHRCRNNERRVTIARLSELDALPYGTYWIQSLLAVLL